MPARLWVATAKGQTLLTFGQSAFPDAQLAPPKRHLQFEWLSRLGNDLGRILGGHSEVVVGLDMGEGSGGRNQGVGIDVLEGEGFRVWKK